MTVVSLQSNSDINLGQHYEFDPEDKKNYLGQGGMGVVFKGKLVHNETGKYEEVAIKVMFKGLSEESVNRAKREASIQIVHENVVRMYGFVETTDFDGKPKYHIISEYLDGEPLSELIKRKKLFSTKEALKITKNVLSGLSMLHDKGYIHRDIDPSNIMICKDGKVKLIDFGIAKKIKAFHEEGFLDEFQQKTMDGKFIGKVNYASPEQVKGEHEKTDGTSDLYSVGILLFQLLTGKLPFNGTTYQIIDGHLNKPMPVKEIVSANLIESRDIQHIVKKATSKFQEKRYQSASEFIVDIEKVEKGIPIVIPFHKRWELWVSISAVILIIVLGGNLFHRGNYSETINLAKEQLSIAMYDNALSEYKKAYAITKTDSIELKMKMLEILTTGINNYVGAEYIKADSLFNIAASMNSSDAYYYLGEMCFEGIGKPKNFEIGFNYMTKASELGCKLAEYRLGTIYQNGINVKADNYKATRLFENSIQVIDKGAEAKNPDMQYLKGDMYMNGNGVTKNIQRAIEYFEMSAEQNCPQAQYKLYEIYNGSDNVKAEEWLIKAANKGYLKAQYKIGETLIIRKQYKEGMDWIQNAAKQNYSPALRMLGAIMPSPENCGEMARSIQQNLGIRGNDSISHSYTQKAVDYDSDDYHAMYDLASDFAKGVGVAKNVQKAKKYFEMAKSKVESLPDDKNGFTDQVVHYNQTFENYLR
jgi:serine/threonine protein kinase